MAIRKDEYALLHPLLKQFIQLFRTHQDLTGFGTFFRSHDTGIRQLVNDPCGTVKADLKHSLQHSDRRPILLHKEPCGCLEILIPLLAGTSGLDVFLNFLWK